ncbi:endonuclease [Bacterioplanes sanyensis]|uniref:Endonuclease n=2 Tax=Bacterioplanes sanyensis TaxID=1249553 RepID=A0A222FPW6_9GAMM|nr:endonuclease [Bacterioplanes sanyensis]
MQVGIHTRGYHDYLLKSWQHLLPSRQRKHALANIADLLKPFDLVALQEADAGSWRSRHENQVECLAQLADFPYWYQQVNRNLGALAQHSNGLLCRAPLQTVEKHALPGLLPGRGLMLATLQWPQAKVTVAVTHLALGKRTQFGQLDYLVSQVKDAEHLIIMGDLNQEAEVLLQHSPLKRLNLQRLPDKCPTFPSWRPQRGLDHILVSDGLWLRQVASIHHPQSDHLPVAAEVALLP